MQSFAIAELVQFLAPIISIDRQVAKTTKTDSGNHTYILHCVKAHHPTKFTKYFWTPFIMASTTKYKNKFCVIDLYFPILYQSQYIWTQVYTDIYNHHHLDDFPPPKFWGASLLSDLLAAAAYASMDFGTNCGFHISVRCLWKTIRVLHMISTINSNVMVVNFGLPGSYSNFCCYEDAVK